MAEETTKTFYVTAGNIVTDAEGKKFTGQAVKFTDKDARRLVRKGLISATKPKVEDDE